MDHNKNKYKLKGDSKEEKTYNTKLSYLAMWLKYWKKKIPLPYHQVCTC